MISETASTLQPGDQLPVKNVGPALTGVVDGTEVSLAVAR
jgi:hypothetical protein